MKVLGTHSVLLFILFIVVGITGRHHRRTAVPRQLRQSHAFAVPAL